MFDLVDVCYRSGGPGTPDELTDLFARAGSIPGAVVGSIPDRYTASRPIYFEGPVSLEQFLLQSRPGTNDRELSPGLEPEDVFLWPSTSRITFVSAFALALLAALFLSATANASDRYADASISKPDAQNVRLAQKTGSADTQPQGRVISFVCGRPNTLQVIAPIDLPQARPVRFLPQGASPIAEMKYMPAAKNTASLCSRAKPDTASSDRVYRKLIKLSLNEPSASQAEAQSLITYFSILTGGQDQKRTNELKKVLGESPTGK